MTTIILTLPNPVRVDLARAVLLSRTVLLREESRAAVPPILKQVASVRIWGEDEVAISTA